MNLDLEMRTPSPLIKQRYHIILWEVAAFQNLVGEATITRNIKRNLSPLLAPPTTLP